MSTPWLRLWVDMPNDPKWRTIARASKQSISSVIAVYLHILVNASNADERGRTQNLCNEDIASALDLECEQVDLIYDAMQGRVMDGDRVKGWEKRQPLREDGSAERAKKWRENQKDKENPESGQKKAKPNAPKTPPNAGERTPNAEKRPEIDTDIDIDTDKYQSSCAETGPERSFDDDDKPNSPAEWIEVFAEQHGVDVDHRNFHDRKKFWPLAQAWTNAGVTVGQMREACAKAHSEATEPIAWLPAYVDRVLASMQSQKQAPKNIEPTWRKEQRERTMKAVPSIAEKQSSDGKIFDVEEKNVTAIAMG